MTDLIDLIFVIITNLGSELFLLATLPIIYYYRREIGLKLATIVLVGIWLTHLLKAYFKIERPPQENWKVSASGYSFPSGHSTNATTYWGYLAYRFREHKFFAILSIILIPLIAYSRMYLGVHRLEDIIGGFIVGLFSIVLIELLSSKKIHNKIALNLGIILAIILPALLVLLTYDAAGSFISEVEISMKTMGAFSGIYVGYLIAEANNLHLPDADNIVDVAIRSVIALILVMVFYLLNKLIEIILVTYVLYWLMGFSITLIVPLILMKGVKNEKPMERVTSWAER